MSSVGILAYASLIEDPGPEIAAAKARIESDVKTPFKVELARTSSTRAGAPTLVPVMTGGGYVPTQIIVLKNTVSEDEARDLIWRRETRRIGSGRRYVHPDNPGPNTTSSAMRERWGNRFGFLHRNRRQHQPTELARLAVQSVAQALPGMDGITYLIDALARGLTTPLSARTNWRSNGWSRGEFKGRAAKVTVIARVNRSIQLFYSTQRSRATPSPKKLPWMDIES